MFKVSVNTNATNEGFYKGGNLKGLDDLGNLAEKEMV